MCAPKTPKLEKVPIRQQQKLPDNGDATASQGNVKRKRAPGPGMMALAATGGLVAPNVTKLGG